MYTEKASQVAEGNKKRLISLADVGINSFAGFLHLSLPGPGAVRKSRRACDAFNAGISGAETTRFGWSLLSE